MLRSVGWCVVTAVSGQYIGYTYKRAASHEDLGHETSATNNHLPVRNIAEQRRPQYSKEHPKNFILINFLQNFRMNTDQIPLYRTKNIPWFAIYVRSSRILASRTVEWFHFTNGWLRSTWTILHSHLSRYTRLGHQEIVYAHVNLRKLRHTCARNERRVRNSRRKMSNPNSKHVMLDFTWYMETV
jgi:hypothetical protein